MSRDEGAPPPGPDGASDGPGDERPGEPADELTPGDRPDQRPEEDGPVGIFPSWRWLYATVLAWFVVVVVVLYVLTVTLDHGAS